MRKKFHEFLLKLKKFSIKVLGTGKIKKKISKEFERSYEKFLIKFQGKFKILNFEEVELKYIENFSKIFRKI